MSGFPATVFDQKIELRFKNHVLKWWNWTKYPFLSADFNISSYLVITYVTCYFFLHRLFQKL